MKRRLAIFFTVYSYKGCSEFYSNIIGFEMTCKSFVDITLCAEIYIC